ncbi:alpha/beta hydrolase family protein [Clostridium tagluense]|uniref:alpha/beta hydrolase family protein n=1 Tax=Clostridium tagluense TaxID=360422 RepID=UPI001C6E526A|nr:hypothetical protein [Clostridium tagluense]MBW9155184.1 hypothetical protein [Clostridium tagluense]WLC64621.1 hypothetical protein KTC93_17410 [Clostridium tagluense]
MKIGRVVRVLTDNSRKEYFSVNNEERKVAISIFYEADQGLSLDHVAYYKDLYEPNKEEFIKRFGNDNEEKNKYLNSIEINTFNNASITKEDRKFPVVLFSSGLGMGRDFYMFNIEELVMKGYMVVTIEHIYDSEFTVLPDGTIIEQAESVMNYTKETVIELINIRKKDILFVLDQLNHLNNKDAIVKNKMDLSKVGAVGHSLGAYSLFESFNEDGRIKVLVMLDGSLQYIDLKKEILEGKKLNKPLLNFRKGVNKYEERMKFFIGKNENKLDAETFKKLIIGQHYTVIKQEEGQEQLTQYLDNYQSLIKLNKTEHMTFSDWFIVENELKDIEMLPIKEAHNIINSVIVSFLDEFLCEINEEYTNIIKNNIYSDLKSLDN